MIECGHRPFSRKNMAYGHWTCQRRFLHLGRHRFNNYTWRHGARLWCDVRYAWSVVRHFVYRHPPWRKAYAKTNVRYDPVPVTGGSFQERGPNA